MHVSFSELLLVLVVALLVIKPAQLPAAAHTAGRWVKWLRRTAAKIRRELDESN